MQSDGLTLEILRDLAPKKTRNMITQELVDKVSKWNEDPKLLGGLKDNILSYIGVLKTGKYRIDEYMNAVRYVSYKLIGHSDIDAYAITFPDRYQRLIDQGVARTDIAPYVSIYRKTQLVVKVFEQTIVPTNVLNAPLHQESLNELWKIGTTARSEMARVQALSKVLDATAPDQTTKIQLDIGVTESDAILDLKESLAELAHGQLKGLERGQVDVKQLGALKPKTEDDFIEVDVDG